MHRCVSVWRGGRAEVITNDRGNRTTPSYVSFSKHERLVGDAAKNRVVKNLRNTVFDIKRLIGRRLDDPKVQSDVERYPFKVINCSEKPYVEVEYRGETKLFVGSRAFSNLFKSLIKSDSSLLRIFVRRSSQK